MAATGESGEIRVEPRAGVGSFRMTCDCGVSTGASPRIYERGRLADGFDDVRQFGGAVAVFACEVDELAGARGHDP